MESLLIVGFVVLAFYAWSARKDWNRTVQAFKRSGRFIVKSLPLFFLAVILIGFIQVVLLPDDEAVLMFFGQAETGILWGTLFGFLLPGPRYAIYPLAEIILNTQGATVGAAMALIVSQQLIDVPEGCFIEIKYLGTKFFLARLAIAIVTTIVAGYMAVLVHGFIPLYIPDVTP
jgi:uncharacterized membrane protein YraQ (UPF0718 family)